MDTIIERLRARLREIKADPQATPGNGHLAASIALARREGVLDALEILGCDRAEEAHIWAAWRASLP